MNPTLKKTLVNASLVIITATAAMAIGSQLPKLIKDIRGTGRSGDFSQHVTQQDTKLTLYGTTTCPFCKKAREYLTAAGIPFTEKLIDKDKAAGDMYDKLKESSVPVLVSATEMVVGFDEAGYERLAKKNTVK